MPDWTYQTVFRPVLRWLPFAKAQAMAFGPMGLLGRHPIGRLVISFMGHAAPPAEVAVLNRRIRLPAGVALGCGVDQSAQAVAATSLFGFGLIEVGPVICGDATGDHVASESDKTEWADAGIAIPAGSGRSAGDVKESIRRNRPTGSVLLFARLLVKTGTQIDDIVDAVTILADVVDGFTIYITRDSTDECLPQDIVSALKPFNRALLLWVSAKIAVPFWPVP